MNNTQSKRLANSINRIVRDPRMNTSLISLYMAMLTCWQNQNFVSRFKVTRRELMQLSKIASTSTYHIYLKKLVDLGYIIYEPTYDSYSGTRVTLTNC